MGKVNFRKVGKLKVVKCVLKIHFLIFVESFQCHSSMAQVLYFRFYIMHTVDVPACPLSIQLLLMAWGISEG